MKEGYLQHQARLLRQAAEGAGPALAAWLQSLARSLGSRLSRAGLPGSDGSGALLRERHPGSEQSTKASALLPGLPDSSWRAMVDAICEPALVLDEAGTVVHHNPLAADLFPRIRTGQPISHVSRSPGLLEAVDGARDADKPVVVQLQDRVPVQRRVSAILSPLRFERAPAGGPALLVVFRDITDQEKLAQMRADFISYASHELRTPLASLKGFVETLQGPARDDAAARERFLKLMAAQANRMTRLIDDLLSLSRVEMSVHVPPRGQVDLNEVLGFVVQSLAPVADAAQVSVGLERLQSPALVRGDREELVQVFQNLVQNAIKYGRTGGRVGVQISRVAGAPGRSAQILVAVRDDGPGIASEHLPRLTERFYRVSPAASREKGGTGLGLAIVKHIVQRHRGELRISSTVGIGSTFEVVLEEMPSAAPVSVG
jgi:two-component system phosphate regulon sensor histidine kinase PhoR